MHTLLTALTYCGIVLSTGSTVWGLLHKLYEDGPNGRRRLTPEGRVSLVLTIVGLAISLNTAVLKDILAAQDRDAASQAAEKRASESALALAQQTNRVVRDIRRGQYPLSGNLRVIVVQRISLRDSTFRADTARMLAMAARMLRGSPSAQAQGSLDSDSSALIAVEHGSPLLPRERAALNTLEYPYRTIQIFDAHKDYRDAAQPEIDIPYSPSTFGWTPDGSGSSRGMTYLNPSHREFVLMGPEFGIGRITSSGTLTSLLDLPGTTLVVSCPDFRGCPIMSIDLIQITMPDGYAVRLEGKSFQRGIRLGKPVLVHRFDPDPERFVGEYLRRP